MKRLSSNTNCVRYEQSTRRLNCIQAASLHTSIYVESRGCKLKSANCDGMLIVGLLY